MPTTNPVLIAAAVIPAILLLRRIYRADRLEKEPISLILKLVLQGIFATILAMGAEVVGRSVLTLFLRSNSILYRLVFYFGVVGLAEEGSKYILMKRNTWRSRDFNCQFDGVVYAVTVSLGFALWENIGYVARYGLANALVRAVTAVPGHACFGVFMGCFYGMAKRYQQMGRQEQSRKYQYLSLLVPTALHGCYDFIASSGGISLIFVAFVVLIFIGASRLTKKLSREDRYITTSAIYYGSEF